MAFGVSINSNSGFTLIDQDYENYTLYSSGSVSATNNGSVGITVNFATDLILVRSNSYNIAICIYAFPSANTITIYAGSATAITVEYVILRKSSIISFTAENYGFEIYKADGAIAYSSRGQVAAIQASLDLTKAQVESTTSFSLSIPTSVLAGKKRYFNLMPAKVNQMGGTPTTILFRGRSGKFVNDNTFTTDLVLIRSIPTPSGGSQFWGVPSSFIILDI